MSCESPAKPSLLKRRLQYSAGKRSNEIHPTEFTLQKQPNFDEGKATVLSLKSTYSSLDDVFDDVTKVSFDNRRCRMEFKDLSNTALDENAVVESCIGTVKDPAKLHTNGVNSRALSNPENDVCAVLPLKFDYPTAVNEICSHTPTEKIEKHSRRSLSFPGSTLKQKEENHEYLVEPSDCVVCEVTRKKNSLEINSTVEQMTPSVCNDTVDENDVISEDTAPRSRRPSDLPEPLNGHIVSPRKISDAEKILSPTLAPKLQRKTGLTNLQRASSLLSPKRNGPAARLTRLRRRHSTLSFIPSHRGQHIVGCRGGLHGETSASSPHYIHRPPFQLPISPLACTSSIGFSGKTARHWMTMRHNYSVS